MKHCSYCDRDVKDSEFLREGYALYTTYENICIHCLIKKQNEDNMYLKNKNIPSLRKALA